MLVVTETDDSGKYFEKNIHSNQLSYSVNEDGLVIIGDKFYQHTIDKIKLLKSEDINRIAKLTETNTIGVIDDISVLTVNNSFSRFCQSNDRRLRIIVYYCKPKFYSKSISFLFYHASNKI